MPLKILEDGSYDLRGATREDVDAAFDDYFKRTPPENNVFLMDEPKVVVGKVRKRLKDFINDVRDIFV